MGFSRQEYWSGLPFPSPGDLPDPGIEPGSPALEADTLMSVGNLISGSSAFSKSSLNIWKFTAHVLLKPCLENFGYYFASMWDEYNCVAVWAFFGIAFLWGWNENWPFPVQWPLLGSKFAGILSALTHHHFLGFGIALLEFHHLR